MLLRCPLSHPKQYSLSVGTFAQRLGQRPSFDKLPVRLSRCHVLAPLFFLLSFWGKTFLPGLVTDYDTDDGLDWYLISIQIIRYRKKR